MDLAGAYELFQNVKAGLDSQVSDLQIEEMAIKMVRWEDFVSFFELSEAEQEEIRKNNPRNYRQQKRAALYAWRQRNGRRATYRALLSEFERVNKQIAMQETNALDTLREYLTECYALAPHPSQSSWPYFENEAAYVDLLLLEAPIKEQEASGPRQQNAPLRKSIKLSEIFLSGRQVGKRQVILLEGVAGSGKTTLTWHAYQQWAEGTLFESFILLIHIPLEDPVIRSATCLADIIPLPSKKMRKAMAEVIAERRGKDICFLLDGWDELPPHLQKKSSFLYNLIEGRSGQAMLPHCSVIVTSRPGASGSLRPLLTARIVIERLDRPRIDELLSQCLSHEESEELSGILNHRPQLANLCNLPINTTVVIHLFRSGIRTLPETRTGLFKALLCNLLIRHMQLRTKHDVNKIGEQFEFDELPTDVQEKFIAISSLAFKGIMEKAKVFDKAALKSLCLSFPVDTISLMETHLTIYGFICSFAFLHYSVQEFLAAWHMTRLGSEEQAKAVSDILHSSPLSPVLPFFAGLTGLSNPAVSDTLLEVTKYPLIGSTILANNPQTESADRRRLALALLNCIYEAQNSSLCELANPPVAGFSPFASPYISFQGLDLETTDCISIGYFMANHICCHLDIMHCSIGDAGVGALMAQLKLVAKPTKASYSNRMLMINCNPITIHCTRVVCEVLQTSVLSRISFQDCWEPTQVATNLKYLIEGLSRRSTSIGLTLPDTVTDDHIHYLVLLLTTCQLHYFNIIYNDWSNVLLLAEGLRHSAFSEMALLFGESFRDNIDTLGLKARTSITALNIFGTHLTTSAVVKLLQHQYFSKLEHLEIGRPLNHKEMAVYEQLQANRFQTNLPPLVVGTAITDTMTSAAYTTVEALNLLPEHVRRRTKM